MEKTAHHFIEYANGTVLLHCRCFETESQQRLDQSVTFNTVTAWSFQFSLPLVHFVLRRSFHSQTFSAVFGLHRCVQALLLLSCVSSFRPCKLLYQVFLVLVPTISQPVMQLYSVVLPFDIATIRRHVGDLPTSFFAPVQNLLRT